MIFSCNSTSWIEQLVESIPRNTNIAGTISHDDFSSFLLPDGLTANHRSVSLCLVVTVDKTQVRQVGK